MFDDFQWGWCEVGELSIQSHSGDAVANAHFEIGTKPHFSRDRACSEVSSDVELIGIVADSDAKALHCLGEQHCQFGPSRRRLRLRRRGYNS